ncbi:MAG: 3-isopropylmalate dehydratase large subunit [Alphaproteobacteria bacterium]
MAATLFDKLWDAHLVGRRADERDIIYMDRVVVHDLHGPRAFAGLQQKGRTVRRPDLTFLVNDHRAATNPGRDPNGVAHGVGNIRAMREGAQSYGIHLYDIANPEQGISHVIAPELGIVLPGMTYAVPDSHACTVGGLGSLAFGSGTTELEHTLATQTMALKRPKTMRVILEGRLGPGVSAKDAALRMIAELGVDGGRDHAVEFAGSVVRAMPLEGRFTLCNLAIEMGARTGLVAPDDITIEWLADRPWVPQGAMWDRAVAHWRTLPSDANAAFDCEVTVNCGNLEPQVSWGTDPSQVIGISGRVPNPVGADPQQRAAMTRALDYMGLTPGTDIDGLPINRVFIGSCTNSRLSDLQNAAAVLRGRHIADGVTALLVPGSTTVRRQAEELGLDKIFKDAGFVWGESACSMCSGGNGDRGVLGDRIASTTNRNFESRQGKGVRTHLMSPAMVAAAAVAGRLVDVRRLIAGA